MLTESAFSSSSSTLFANLQIKGLHVSLAHSGTVHQGTVVHRQYLGTCYSVNAVSIVDHLIAHKCCSLATSEQRLTTAYLRIALYDLLPSHHDEIPVSATTQIRHNVLYTVTRVDTIMLWLWHSGSVLSVLLGCRWVLTCFPLCSCSSCSCSSGSTLLLQSSRSTA